jgi:hypothetical protein
MKEILDSFSPYGSVGIRFTSNTFSMLKRELEKDEKNERFMFALVNQAKTADGIVLLVQDLFVPDEKDLINQSVASVIPSRDFQATVYCVARQRRQGILDIHTHPFSKSPVFSSIDYTEGAKNAEYITKKMPYPATHSMVVFDNKACVYDAAFYDRNTKKFLRIDSIEVLGRRTSIKRSKKTAVYNENNPTYQRQTIIQLQIAIIGLGGNGAQLFEALVSIGVGAEGWIAGIDPDILEQTNLPRIPYAYTEHIGSPKVTVAAQYAGRKNPEVKFYPYPCSATEKAATERIKAAHVIICAGDGDGLRKYANELSVKYMIPLIDLGCEIHAEEKGLATGGQVRIVLPGTNACLVCCGGYDPSIAAIELLDDEQFAVRAAAGYVSGHRSNPTPSIANLNAITSQLGINTLLALVHGERFGNWDYVHYDYLTAKTLVAKSDPSESCPVCGKGGILGAGDITEEQEERAEPKWTDSKK